MNLYRASVPQIDRIPATLARLLVAICESCQFGKEVCQEVLGVDEHIELPLHDSRIPNMAAFKEQVIKVYHPPDEGDEWYCRPDLYPRLLKGSQIKVNTSAVKVLTYPWVKGETCPPTLKPRHFLMAAEQLQKFYRKGLEAHGDIRMANLIVSKKKVRWIDFDYSVMTNEPTRVYPDSWNMQLSDAKRHQDAYPQHPIERSHDLFSFKHLLGFYRSSDGSWERFVGTVKPKDIDGMVEKLRGFVKQSGKMVLSAPDEWQYQRTGTGSPKKQR